MEENNLKIKGDENFGALFKIGQMVWCMKSSISFIGCSECGGTGKININKDGVEYTAICPKCNGKFDYFKKGPKMSTYYIHIEPYELKKIEGICIIIKDNNKKYLYKVDNFMDSDFYTNVGNEDYTSEKEIFYTREECQAYCDKWNENKLNEAKYYLNGGENNKWD